MRKTALIFIMILFAAVSQAEKVRLIVETDMGGDKDDQASFVRLLMYANEFDLEAIILDRSDAQFQSDGAASNPTGASTAFEMANDYIDAYGQVRPNLIKHKSDYPTVSFLKSITVRGHDATNVGRDLLISAVDKNDSRPVWFGNWGSNSGTTSNLKRALDYVKANRSTSQYNAFCAKLRICSLDSNCVTIGNHKDEMPICIDVGYPDMDGGRWYHRFASLVGASSSDVTSGHGALGAIWTGAKEGDTWCFEYLIPSGLHDPEKPEMGSWAGRYAERGGSWPAHYYQCNQQDYYSGSTNRDNTVKRWKDAPRRDFKARMDWCVASSFGAANHEPKPVVQGNTTLEVLYISAAPGASVSLSAAGSSDPDGDSLSYAWTQYKEADSYGGSITINNSTSQTCQVQVPSNAADTNIHIILDVTDDGSVPMTRFRRVIIEVNSSGNTPPSVDAGSNQTITLPDDDAGLNGTVNDPDDTPSLSWSKVSGPGSVNFSNPSSEDPTVTFGASGTYVLKLSANDGTNPAVTDTVTITVDPEPFNAPTNLQASAISDSRIDLSWNDNSNNETGFIIERTDGSSGPLSVAVTDYQGTDMYPTIEAAGTTASFQVGALVVNDRGDTWTSVPAGLDGCTRLLTARDDRNQSPAGSYYTVSVTAGCTIYLPLDPRYAGKLSWMDGSWTDSGLSCNSSAGTGWTIWKKDISSAGSVALGVDTSNYDGMCYVFKNGAAWSEIATVGANTTSYNNTGLAADTAYTYRVKAYKSGQETAHTNTDTATTQGSAPSNTPPTVDAGSNQTITLPDDDVSLNATVNDPDDTPSLSWSKVSGPGTVSFSSASVEDPTATFGASGSYVLKLTANDGTNPAVTDTVTITVNPEPSGDLDGDSIPDTWEQSYFSAGGCDPLDDPDGDGLNNLGEYNSSTDPWGADTDGDGILDGADPNPLTPDAGPGDDDSEEGTKAGCSPSSSSSVFVLILGLLGVLSARVSVLRPKIAAS